jgi:DNA primase
MQMLSRLCGEIILLFDADSAGIKASLRSLELADNVSVAVKVATLPQGDPFEYVTEKGPRPFMAIVDSAMNPVDFKISRIIAAGIGTTTQQLLALFTVIQNVGFETEKMAYLRRISSLLKLDESAVMADFRRFINRKPLEGPQAAVKTPLHPDKNGYLTQAYREIIRLLLAYPALIETAVIDFAACTIENTLYGAMLNSILRLHREGETITLDKMFDFFNEGLELEFLNQIAQDDTIHENPELVYGELYINLKLYDINTKINRYADLIKNNADGNKMEYLTEIEVLRREKEKLSQYLYNK